MSGTTFPTTDPVDFLVLGAGAAGGVVAKELATAGFSVVVLEQGPYLREKDYSHDEIKYAVQPGLTNDPKVQPIMYRRSEAEKARPIKAIEYGRQVGGGSVHFTANYWRFHESDFHERSLFGEVSGASLADWPVSYADLEPYYTKAEYDLGISGLAGANLDANLDTILAAGQKMVAELDLEYLTVTLSEKGIALLRTGSQFIAPAVARQVFDVSGAGDTVIATLALASASGLEMEAAIELANIAAGIVVSKVGTVPIDRDGLLGGLQPEIELKAEEKVLSLEQLKVRASAWRSTGQKVVFTNGCFDLLHIGHIALLEDARREGDRLIVAINSDASTSRLKGPTRPIVGERERARILAALTAVDAVVVFDDPTPLRYIQELRPDILVKGGDYNEETVVGAKEVRSWGGSVKIVPIVEGFSTTKLVSKATAGLVE